MTPGAAAAAAVVVAAWAGLATVLLLGGAGPDGPGKSYDSVLIQAKPYARCICLPPPRARITLPGCVLLEKPGQLGHLGQPFESKGFLPLKTGPLPGHYRANWATKPGHYRANWAAAPRPGGGLR